MNTEKIVLSFVAIFLGLLVAGGAFYFYQSTKTVPQSDIKIISIAKPTPTPQPSVFLALSSPEDESVTDQRTIKVAGKTTGDAIVVILTQSNEQIAKPTNDGSFSATVNIDAGQNIIEVTAIAPNGEETKISRTVAYSIEEF